MSGAQVKNEAIVSERGPASEVGARARKGGVRVFLRQPLGLVSLITLAAIVLASMLAPVLAPYDPMAINANSVLSPPSANFWLGTDDFGRDILSRIMWGGRISLMVGFFSVLLGVGSGAALGLMTGFKGGRLDLILQRLTDALMAFPTLVLALALVSMLGTNTRNIILAISITLIPNSARVIRSVVLSIKHELYVEAAHAIGCSDLRIIVRHVVPNVVGPIMVVATSSLGSAIIAEAALSFVGLGTPPPTPSWGQMMTGSARTYIVTAPWMAFFPGAVLSLLVLAINLFGDTLRDAFDPWLRRR